MKKEEEVVVSAKLWKRLIAFIIDLLLINIILSFSFSSVISGLVPETTNPWDTLAYVQENPEVANSLNLINRIMMGIIFLYFVIMERVFSKTIGKMLMHIRVKSLDNKLKLWQCLARSLFLIPFFPFSLFWVIEPISLLFIKDHRRSLELLSKTATVEESSDIMGMVDKLSKKKD